MSLSPQILTALFERALVEELGIVIQTNSPDTLKFRLHQIRAAMPQFAYIMICLPSTPGELYLIKRSVELEEHPPL